MKTSIAIEFGERQGWRLSERHFGPKVLARGGVSSWEFESLRSDYMDHPFYYRKNNRAVAMAVHLYALPEIDENLIEWAKQQRLGVWFPTDFPSWHFYGHTRLVVYLGPAGVCDLLDKGIAFHVP